MSTLSSRAGWCFAVLLSAWSIQASHGADGQSWASLPDPTRPPAGLMPQPAGSASAASAPSPAASASSGAAASGPALTMIKVDARTGRAWAWMGEKVVAVGDRWGDAVVAAIDTRGITLKTPKGMRRLSLWKTAQASQAARETPESVNVGGKDTP